MSALTEQQKTEIKEMIAKASYANIDDVQDSSNLCHELGMDSLDQLEMIIALENSFDIFIPDEDAEKMVLVSDVYTIVEDLLSN